jgi:phage I-like protein
LPVGDYQTSKYGELNFTPQFCQQIVDNWKNKVLGEREPFIDVEHDRGEAQGWVKDLQFKDDGLYADIEWTPVGREKVERKLYKYFSVDLAKVISLDGSEHFPVLIAIALTNQPVINCLDPVKLSDSSHLTKQGEKRVSYSQLGKREKPGNPKIKLGEEPMQTFEELLAAIKEMIGQDGSGLTPEQKDQVSDLLEGVNEGDEGEGTPPEGDISAGKKKPEVDPKADAVPPADPLKAEDMSEKKMSDATRAEIEALKESNKALSLKLSEVAKVQHNDKIEKELGLALSEGRITPADKEKWRKRLVTSFASVQPILRDMPKNERFSESGFGGEPVGQSGKDENSMSLSEAKELGKAMGWTEEEQVNMSKYGKLTTPKK